MPTVKQEGDVDDRDLMVVVIFTTTTFAILPRGKNLCKAVQLIMINCFFITSSCRMQNLANYFARFISKLDEREAYDQFEITSTITP